MRETLEFICGPIESFASPQNYGDGVESYLRVHYVSPSLSGEFDWYIDRLDLHFGFFVKQLEHYPLNPTDLPLLELFGGDAPGLRITIEPVGPTGKLALILQMNEDGAADNMLRKRTEIDYATVQRLANELRRVMADGGGSIELELN